MDRASTRPRPRAQAPGDVSRTRPISPTVSDVPLRPGNKVDALGYLAYDLPTTWRNRRTSSDAEATAINRAVLALVGSGQGRIRLAVDLASDAVLRSPQTDVAHRALVTALLRADRVDEAEQALARARATTSDQAPLDSLVAVLRFRTGRWDGSGGEQAAGDTTARAIRGMIAVHRNQLDLADRLLAVDTDRADSHAHWLAWARGLCAEARKEHRTAGGAPGGLDDVHANRFGRRLRAARPGSCALAARRGSVRGERGTAAQVHEIATRTGSPAATGASLRCAALLDDDPGAASRAVQILARALPACRRPGVRAGGRHHGYRRPTGLLRRARDGYRALGAHRDLARVDARLRALGVRCHPDRRAAPTDRGWDSLTCAERSVVDLTARGLTNREIAGRLFISPRTVETHLSHVYAKLGVAGRPGLRVAVARRPSEYGGLPDVRDAGSEHNCSPRLRPAPAGTAKEGPGR